MIPSRGSHVGLFSIFCPNLLLPKIGSNANEIRGHPYSTYAQIAMLFDPLPLPVRLLNRENG